VAYRPPASSWPRRHWWPIVLAAVLAFQAMLLHTAATRDVAPYPPLRFDQAAYLTESYLAYERMRDQGFLRGLLSTVRERRAQGWLLQPEAAVLFAVLGAVRMTAIDLNIAYYLLYLGVTGEVVRRRLDVGAALMALGLICSARTITSAAGGVFDFRLDFVGLCLWGIWVVLLALVAPSRQPVVWIGLGGVGVVLILTRVITAAYVLPILVGLALLTLVGVGRGSGTPVNATRRRLAMMVAGLMAVLAVVAFRNWTEIAGYYIQGHLLSSEKTLRALDAGVVTLADSLSYYPISALRDHAGRELLLLMLLALGTVIVLALWRRNEPERAWRPPEVDAAPRLDWVWTSATLLLAIHVPYAVLTLNETKSPITGHVLVPPLVLLGTVGLHGLLYRALVPRGDLGKRLALWLGTVVLALGLLLQLDRVVRPQFAPASPTDLASASRMSLEVGDYLQRTHVTRARWGTDTLMDVLAGGTSQVYYFEQRGVWLGIVPGLGQAAISADFSVEEVLREADTADVLLLANAPGEQRAVRYPLEQSLQKAAPELRELAHRGFLRLGEYEMFGQTVSAYVRPGLKLEGLTPDGWITSRGIDVVVSPEGVPRASAIILRGQSFFNYFQSPLVVSATMLRPNGAEVPLPTHLQVTGTAYEIMVEIPPGLVELARTLRVHLDFSTYYQPSVVAGSPDQRELVIQSPTFRRVRLGAQRD
jgi:hypothetical protein